MPSLSKRLEQPAAEPTGQPSTTGGPATPSEDRPIGASGAEPVSSGRAGVKSYDTDADAVEAVEATDATTVKAPRKYTPPTRWEDPDYSGRDFRGSRPVWEIEGKVFAGPSLVPEVSSPRTAMEEKRAKAVLFDLWHHACIVADANPTAQGRINGVDYYGVDDKGRHRIT